MIKAIIFDMDGILFDTERIAMQSWEKAGHDLGVDGMGDIVPSVLGLSAAASWDFIRAKAGDDFAYDTFRKLAHDYSFDYFAKYGVPVKEGVVTALEYLRQNGYLTAVGTSTRRESAMHHFEKTGLKHCFDDFACGDEVQNSKPAPDVFLLAAAKLGVDPADCMVMEDSPNGIKAAVAAGMTPVMVPDLAKPTEEIIGLIAYQLESLSELPQLLENIKAAENTPKTIEESLEALRLLARKTPALKEELLATQKADQPLTLFCEIAQREGFGIQPGEMLKLGQDYYDNLFKSCNGAAVTPPEGWEDAYEMFLASLF